MLNLMLIAALIAIISGSTAWMLGEFVWSRTESTRDDGNFVCFVIIMAEAFCNLLVLIIMPDWLAHDDTIACMIVIAGASPMVGLLCLIRNAYAKKRVEEFHVW